MNPQQLQLARRRLLLGITNVGCWVSLAAIGLLWLSNANPGSLNLGSLGWILGAAVAVQAGFDLIGGTLLMPEPQRRKMDSLRHSLRGILAHSLVLIGTAVLSAASFRLTGGFCSALFLGTLGLALGRRHLLRAVAGVSTRDFRHHTGMLLAADTTDPAFTGGLVGLGRNATSVVPANWLDTLPPHELDAELSRREWQRQDRLPLRTWILLVGWNLLGGSVGSLVFNLDGRSTAEALFGHACCMTLWAFIGLLVLPVLSRKAVFAADRAAAHAGCDPRSWILRFPERVGEDGSSRTAVQAIFYPIPSAALRLRQLEQPESGFVLGPLARSNLYYSWATLTLLGRAVHCNVGRPALWVFPPSA